MIRLWKKILIILLIFFAFFTTIDIIFNTPILYSHVADEPIKVYWANTPVQQAENQTSIGTANIGEFAPPKYTVSDLTLSVSNPLSSDLAFQIDCANYTQSINFLTNDNSSLNLTKITNYEHNNLPDIMVTCPSIKDGNFSTWIQVWQQYQKIYPYQPLTKQLTKPFLTQTSFDTWEGKFRFDDSFGMITMPNESFNITAPLSNELFLVANVSQISFQVILPNNFDVQNSGSVTIEGTPTTPISVSNQIASKTITSGETFDLIVTNTNLEPWQNAFGLIGSVGFPSIIISLIADLVIGILLDRQKVKKDKEKENEDKKPNREKNIKPIYIQPKNSKRNRNKSKKGKGRG